MAKSLAQRTSYAGRASRRHMALVTLARRAQSRRLAGVANLARAIRRCATALPLPSPFQPLSLERRQVVDVLVTRYLFILSYSLVSGSPGINMSLDLRLRRSDLVRFL